MTIEAPQVTTAKKTALYAAVGTLVIAAGITVWAIIANPPGDTVGKAVLTLILMAGFSFAAIGEASSTTRPSYVVVGRIGLLVGVAVGGLLLTWIQRYPEPWRDFPEDLASLIAIAVFLEGIAASLLLGHPRWVANMTNPLAKNIFNFGFFTTIATLVLLSIPNALNHIEWSELYWRIVLAAAVISLVTLVIPLIVNAILRPERPAAQSIQYQNGQQSSSALAGWYPSERPGFERYWNGTGWTDSYKPSPGLQEAPPAEKTGA